MKNSNLHRAKTQKNDEFYTQLTDVSKELMHYKKHFKDKIVLCNCDDPTWSAFWKYFHLNFSELGLKRLVSTHYEKSEYTFGKKKERSYVMVYEGGNDNDETVGIKTPLKGDGDFRSSECIEILKQCDIVVTNPPFSLFREFVAQLIEYDKKFLIIGNKNAVEYSEVFAPIKANNLWMGYCSPSVFDTPEGLSKKVQGLCRWFTNLDISKRYEKLVLWKTYNPNDYPKYDYIDAIEVGKVAEIPMDYDGIMGVPLTFMDYYNPDQFEIIDCTNGRYAILDALDVNAYLAKNHKRICSLDEHPKYARLLIRKKVDT